MNGDMLDSNGQADPDARIIDVTDRWRAGQTTLAPGEELVAVVDELAGPPRGVTRWAAVKHQARLLRQVQRIARLFAEGERNHRDALELIRTENRALHRRALEAEGFIAYSGLETTYGVRDTSRRPTTPATMLDRPDREHTS